MIPTFGAVDISHFRLISANTKRLFRSDQSTSPVDFYSHLLAKTFASQPVVRDPGALKRGSCGLEGLSGGGIRGPGPMGRGARCRSHGEYGWRYTK